MTANTTTPAGIAIVCVGFDKETPNLTKAAVSLARRTGVDLRFVHVLEMVIPDVWLIDMPLYNVAPTLIRESQDKLRREKESALRELLAGLPSDVKATATLLDGEPVPAIVQEARSRGANLIMTACNLDNYAPLMPNGFSVALRLMAEAPLPVFVTNTSRPIDFNGKKFAILLADDLQPASEEAVRKTFELASFLDGCRIRQVHVHGDFRALMHSTWLDIKAQYPSLQRFGETPADILHAEYEARLAALAARGGPFRKAAAGRGVIVEPDVLVGNVVDRLDDETRDVDPDLIVFGRHRALKTRPFLIGRVGLRAMLNAKRSVLVVPPHDELYAAMPFPARRG